MNESTLGEEEADEQLKLMLSIAGIYGKKANVNYGRS